MQNVIRIKGWNTCGKNFTVGQIRRAQKYVLKLLVLNIEQVIALQPTINGFEPYWKTDCNFSSVG